MYAFKCLAEDRGTLRACPEAAEGPPVVPPSLGDKLAGALRCEWKKIEKTRTGAGSERPLAVATGEKMKGRKPSFVQGAEPRNIPMTTKMLFPRPAGFSDFKFEDFRLRFASVFRSAGLRAGSFFWIPACRRALTLAGFKPHRPRS